MAIAALLNAFTTRTSIVTVLTVTDDGHEGFFASSEMIPGDLRRKLSPIFVRLRQYQRPTDQKSGPAAADVVSKLERLAALHLSGVLTDEEFVAAKANLLAGQ